MHILQGRYEIQKMLGDRYGRKTFLARDRHTQTFVVIKQLLFHSELKWEALRLFEREANTLKSLSHPAIPRYLDYFEVETKDGKGFALVQSFIAAESLRQRVSSGRRFSETELKAIARSVLGILTYLHSAQPPVIHRDIKPSNILISDKLISDELKGGRIQADRFANQIFLVDFGAVQAMQNEDGTRTVVGTYGYMPPEQFGDRAVPASDLYGLGTTLIYLASGQQPADLPHENLRLQFEAHVSLSSAFTHWLSIMTEPALERRFSSAQQALRALNRESSAPSYSPSYSRSKGSRSKGSRSNASTPLFIKPLDSRISLTKAADRLKVGISPRGFTLALVPDIIFTVLWNAGVFPLYVIAFSMGIAGLLPAIFGLAHIGVGVLAILNILYSLFGTTVLTVDAQTFSYQRKMLGLPIWKPKTVHSKYIIKIEKTVTSEEQIFLFKRMHTTSASLNIRATDKNLTIGNGDHLSKIDIEWLANELIEWLDLPAKSQSSGFVVTSPDMNKIALYGEENEKDF